MLLVDLQVVDLIVAAESSYGEDMLRAGLAIQLVCDLSHEYYP